MEALIYNSHTKHFLHAPKNSPLKIPVCDPIFASTDGLKIGFLDTTGTAKQNSSLGVGLMWPERGSSSPPVKWTPLPHDVRVESRLAAVRDFPIGMLASYKNQGSVKVELYYWHDAVKHHFDITFLFTPSVLIDKKIGLWSQVPNFGRNVIPEDSMLNVTRSSIKELEIVISFKPPGAPDAEAFLIVNGMREEVELTKCASILLTGQ